MKTDSSEVKVVNIRQKLSFFNKYWNPKIVGIESKTGVNTGNITTENTAINQERI